MGVTMAYTIITTEVFSRWARRLRDKQAARAIALRLARARSGNLGDCKALGGGLNEMRIHIGKGYRLYYSQRGDTLIILLCGGAKATQADDIERARRLAASLPDNCNDD
jgi:putative addiction module killer protein